MRSQTTRKVTIETYTLTLIGMQHKSTEELIDVYNDWLESNGFDADLGDAEGAQKDPRINDTQREWLRAFCRAWDNAERRECQRDVIARFAIGVEAVDDGIGAVCISNRGDGFAVFITAERLPDGTRERHFPASDLRCLANAYAFALEIVAKKAAAEVQIDETKPWEN